MSFRTLRTDDTDALREVFGGLLTDLAGVSFVPGTSTSANASINATSSSPSSLLVLSQETKRVARLTLTFGGVGGAGGVATFTPNGSIAVYGRQPEGVCYDADRQRLWVRKIAWSRARGWQGMGVGGSRHHV